MPVVPQKYILYRYIYPLDLYEQKEVWALVQAGNFRFAWKIFLSGICVGLVMYSNWSTYIEYINTVLRSDVMD